MCGESGVSWTRGDEVEGPGFYFVVVLEEMAPVPANRSQQKWQVQEVLTLLFGGMGKGILADHKVQKVHHKKLALCEAFAQDISEPSSK